MADLAQRGSLSLTSPVLFDYIKERDAMIAMSKDLFDVVAKGAVRISSPTRLKLSEASQAHRQLENRETNGATILIP